VSSDEMNESPHKQLGTSSLEATTQVHAIPTRFALDCRQNFNKHFHSLRKSDCQLKQSFTDFETREGY